MNWLAMMIVASTLFGADVESEAEEIRGALSGILDQFERSILPHADREDFESALTRLDDTVYRLIQERRKTNEDHGDLLSMLLLVQDAEEEGGRMTDLQVRDEAMTIFLAGHETSANALAWSWHLLAQHPEIEAQFHEEIDRVLTGRLPRMDDLPALGLDRPHLRRSAPPLSAALGDRPAGDRGMRDRSLHDPGRLSRDPVGLRHATRRPLVPRAG